MLKIYVDLDECLTAFVAAVQALGPEAAAGLSYAATDEQKKVMYKAIEKAGPDFWINMDWAPGGEELWQFLAPHNPVLLSSPGNEGMFRTYAEIGKREWVQNHMPGTTLFLEPDKHQYAERDAVLIDDMKDNVSAWIQCGGIGILHKDADSTIQQMQKLLASPNPQPADFISVSAYLRRVAAWMFKLDLQRIVRSLSSTWNSTGVHQDPDLFMEHGGRDHIQSLLKKGYSHNDLSTAIREVTENKYGLDSAGELVPTSPLPGGGGRKVAPTL